MKSIKSNIPPPISFQYFRVKALLLKFKIFIQTAEARREVVPKDLEQQASYRRQLKNELKYALLLNQVESNKISVVVTPFTPYIPIRKINRK